MEGRRWDAIKVDNKAKVAAGWGSVRDLALAKFPAAGVGLRIDATQLPKGVERLAPLAGSMN
jgi:hypothetical protein